MKTQLDRLNAIGGLKSVVPSEGITFVFKGKLYKYTGAFAPANQILGMLKFVSEYVMAGYCKEAKKQNDALQSILEAGTPEKTIQVGYEGKKTSQRKEGEDWWT